MPRAVDLRIPKADKDPLANLLDFSNIDQAAELAGSLIRGYLDSLLDGVVNVIEDLTGLDLTQLADLLHSLDISSPEAFVTSLINLLVSLPDVLLSLLDQLLNMLVTLPGQLTNLLTGLLEQLTAATGVDLMVFLPLIQDLDYTDPIGFFVSLGEALLAVGGSLLGIDSPLNAELLFNLIPTDLMSLIPASNIGEAITNMITDPTFLDVGRFRQWRHLGHRRDRRIRRARGDIHHRQRHPRELFGNLIPVSEGQIVPIAATPNGPGWWVPATRLRWRSPATTAPGRPSARPRGQS